MFQFWLLLCNGACRYSQISLNSTSQVGESNNNLRTRNPLPRLSYLFVCVGAKVFAAAVRRFQLKLAAAPRSSVSESRRHLWQNTLHCSAFQRRHLPGKFPFQEHSPSTLPLFPSHSVLPNCQWCERERECCFNKQSRCGGDYLTPAV